MVIKTQTFAQCTVHAATTAVAIIPKPRISLLCHTTFRHAPSYQHEPTTSGARLESGLELILISNIFFD